MQEHPPEYSYQDKKYGDKTMLFVIEVKAKDTLLYKIKEM